MRVFLWLNKVEKGKCVKKVKRRSNYLIYNNMKTCSTIEKEDIKKRKIQEKSNKIFNNEYLLIGDLIKDKCLTKHLKCEYEWLMNYNNHIYKSKRCPKCYGNVKLTINDIQEKSNKLHNNEFLINELFKNKKIKITHIKCGYEYLTSVDSHIHCKSGCPKCYGNAKLTIDNVISYSNNKEYIVISNQISNNRTRILVKHDKCGETWEISVSNFLRGRGCGKCKKNKKLDINIIQKRSDKLHNSEYEFIGKYMNANIPVLTKHKKCGHVWNMLVCAHLSKRMVGCPNCTRSIGERKIEKWFIDNSIEFKIEHHFDKCLNVKKLPFDFYLEKYNLCIEYDGEQHFRPIKHFGGDEKYKKQKINDTIKNNYCLENNINLFRIRYDENIETKLLDYFNKQNILK